MFVQILSFHNNRIPACHCIYQVRVELLLCIISRMFYINFNISIGCYLC